MAIPTPRKTSTSRDLKSKKETTAQSAATKELKKQLLKEYKNAWDLNPADEHDFAFAFAEEYMAFLDQARTEREFVTLSVETLENMGFEPLQSKAKLVPGDKVYKNIRNKGLAIAVIGRQPAVTGFNLIGAHIDAPRIDLKANPVYEDGDLVYFKTHYYGGIKKYQWTAIPLSLHGVVHRADGSLLTISIGDRADEPVLTITDLLPHLGSEQMSKKATEVIRGEDLNVLISGIPFSDTETGGRFKLGLLNLLKEKYDLTEADLVTAELEIVPAFPARDVGLDRSMIGAYAHDDRSCSFPALVALTSVDRLEQTGVTFLFDKEEIGSEGNTGAKSKVYEHFIYELYAKQEDQPNQLDFYRLLENSRMLSGDVTNAFDPTFASVSDPRNNAYMGRGINYMKFGGSRGKAGTSDANSEFYASIINLMEENKIAWQTGELGKVDAGGGGTIAGYMANLGIEVIDCGVPVLSMHSPFEIISKIDLYHTFLAYKVFFQKMAR
ncbi:MAG: aminopeptidase [Eubacteriales bacterium]|nr:aminopeptidase [Eubacteriales bacterium]